MQNNICLLIFKNNYHSIMMSHQVQATKMKFFESTAISAVSKVIHREFIRMRYFRNFHFPGKTQTGILEVSTTNPKSFLTGMLIR